MQITMRTEHGGYTEGTFKVTARVEGPTGYSGEWGVIGLYERTYTEEWREADAFQDLLSGVVRLVYGEIA